MTSRWKVLCDQFNMKPCVFVIALVLHLTEANYGVKYLGCFGDDPDQRALNQSYTHLYAVTVDLCVNHCAVEGYRYAGLQLFDECRCGDSGYDRYGERSECNFLCSRNIAQICGGYYKNSVYEIVPVTTTPHSSETTTTKPYTSMSSAGQPQQVYLGCFLTGGVSNIYTDQNNLTVGACLDHCNETGYRYAWLNNGDRCRCGESGLIADQTRKNNCHFTCSGNSSQICGSYFYHSLYIRVRYAVKHLGCYYDGYPRTLNETDTYSVHTASTCMDHCDSQGYRYAGLQYGKLCRCGNDGYDRYGKATGCDITCAADSSQLCGGFYQNSVYEIVHPTVTTTSTSLLTTKVSAQTTTFTVEGNGAEDMSSKIGQYAGIGVSVLVICVGVAIGLILCIRRRKRRSNGNREASPENMPMRSVEPEASSNASHVPQAQDEDRDTDLCME